MIFYVVELLDDWNVDVPSWKYPRNLESPRVSSPAFGNDSKMMVINRRSTASDLSRQLSSATGTTVSRQTVYRRLGHIGLYARKPVRCVPLTATHCHLRLTWSREHALWTPQQWSYVMFSDESRFSFVGVERSINTCKREWVVPLPHGMWNVKWQAFGLWVRRSEVMSERC
ncbi:transposable element Tcb1 transposase [Trichonephila clavipes]|nr:transposable element Tcb1 transposase [Trichonephila clavipes]